MPDYDEWARSIGDPPTVAEIWREKLKLVTDQFMARQISDAVFRRHLCILGFHGVHLDCEFRLLDSIRNHGEGHRRELET